MLRFMAMLIQCLAFLHFLALLLRFLECSAHLLELARYAKHAMHIDWRNGSVVSKVFHQIFGSSRHQPLSGTDDVRGGLCLELPNIWWNTLDTTLPFRQSIC